MGCGFRAGAEIFKFRNSSIYYYNNKGYRVQNLGFSASGSDLHNPAHRLKAFLWPLARDPGLKQTS